MTPERRQNLNRLLIFWLIMILIMQSTPQQRNTSAGPNDWVIDGNTVYVNDTLVYASATPHTVHGTEDIIFEFESKSYSGDIDFIWGFNENEMKPQKIWLWQNYSHPHSYYEGVETYACTTLYNVTFYEFVGIENYSRYNVDVGTVNNTYLVNFTTNGENFTYAISAYTPLGGGNFQVCGNYSKPTKFWDNQTYFDWKLWDVQFVHYDWIYENMTDWYVTPETAIVSGKRYKCKVHVTRTQWNLNNVSGKYWFAFKPSSESLAEAVANDHLYALDPWYNSNWDYKKKITINASMVDYSLSNYPLFISVNDTDLRDHAQTDGDDILFTNSAENTQLYHEIETWNPGTGELSVWINISSLSSTTDTEIYMYYSNAAASCQQNPTAVWHSAYQGVWHLNDSDWKDSTSNNVDLSATNTPQIKDSPLGNGTEFNGNSCLYHPTFQDGSQSAMSILIWGNISGDPDDEHFMVCKQQIGGATGTYYQLVVRYDVFRSIFKLQGNQDGPIGVGTVTQAEYFLHGMKWATDYDRVTFTQNGTSIYNDTTTSTWNSGTMTNFHIGAYNGVDASTMEGVADEVRVYKGNLTENYFTVCTDNFQNAYDGGFYSFGPEVEEGKEWAAPGWKYSKRIWVNHSQVSENMSYFTLPVNLTDSDLSSHAQIDGDDICFYDDSNDTQLGHEIEIWNSTTGRLLAWVNVTDISATEDSYFWMYYGNLSCSSQQSIPRTWSSRHLAIFHLNDTTWRDSQGNVTMTGHHDPTVNTTGFGAAMWANGTSYLSNGTFLDTWTTASSGGVTFIAIINAVRDTSSEQWIVTKQTETGASTSYLFAELDGNLIRATYGVDGTQGSKKTSGVRINEWYAISVQYSGNDEIFATKNNNYSNPGTGFTKMVNGTSDDFQIAAFEGNNQFNGLIEEVRVIDVNGLDYEYIEALTNSYNNSTIGAPNAYLSIGAQNDEDDRAPYAYNPVPADGAAGQDLSVTLNVDVRCPSGEHVNVTFYNASDDIIIGGKQYDKVNETVDVLWQNLSYNSTYNWYVIVESRNFSDLKNGTWSFTTKLAEDPTHIELVNLTETWNMTWSGNASRATIGDPLKRYTNNSGTYNQTMAIECYPNSTERILNISIYHDQLNTSDNSQIINADNITVWVSGDNSTWHRPTCDLGYGNGVFMPNGGYIEINSSTWNEPADNPFNYHGDGTYITSNCTIFVRLQLNFEYTVAEGIYTNKSVAPGIPSPHVFASNGTFGAYSESVYFTTKATAYRYYQPPIFSNEDPGNGTTVGSLAFNWSVDINNPSAEPFNYTIQCNNTQKVSANHTTNGTKYLDLVGLSPATSYKVWVNASSWNSTTFTREWYTFSTSSGITASSENPANNSYPVANTLTEISVHLEQADGLTYNWSIETSPNVGSNSSNNDNNGTKNCTVALSNAGNITYRWYVNATDGANTINYSYYFRTEHNAPNVSTNTSSGVTDTDAQLNGFLFEDGGGACSVWFQWGTTVAYGNKTANQSLASPTSVSANIGGLTAATTYHYRIVANNSNATVYGADQAFTTSVNVSNVTTNASTSVSFNSAVLHGFMIDDGGETCTVWFEYGKTVGFGTNTSNQQANSTENFSATISNLDSATKYYFRAVSQNSNATSYGATLNFTTGVNPIPDISNEDPSNNSYYIAKNPTISVQVNDSTGDNITVNFYNWSDDSLLGTDTLNANGTASTIWYDLVSNATYKWYVKAYNPDVGGATNNTSAVFFFHTQNVSPPTGASLFVYNHSTINVTWTDGSNCTQTLIVYKAGGIPTDPSDGTLQNESDASSPLSITGLTGDTAYGFRVWGYNVSTKHISVDSWSDTATTYPGPPSSFTATSVNATIINLTWVKGSGSDKTVIYYNTTTFPNTPSNGTLCYNNTGVGDDITGLSPNTTYYFSAWSWGNSKSHLSVVYVTASANTTGAPDEPLNFNATAISASRIDLSWSKGNKSTKTRIVRKTTSYPSSYTDGTLVYFDTGTSYSDTSLNTSQIYYYRAWGYNDTTAIYSSANASTYNWTFPQVPQNITGTQISSSIVNITWNLSIGGDMYHIRKKSGGYPENISDGNLKQNSSRLFYNDTAFASGEFYAVWAYNNSSGFFSSRGLVYIGNLIIYAYREDTPTTNITNYTITMSNQNGSETYYETDCNNPKTISISLVPQGDDISIIVSKDGFYSRVQHYDIDPTSSYTIKFYLAPNPTGGGVEGDGDYVPPETSDTVLKTTDAFVANHSNNLTISLECEPDPLVSVEGYNSSLYGHWFPIPEEKYNQTWQQIEIDESMLDNNTQTVRVTYYCSNNESYAVQYLINVVGPQGEFSSRPIEEARVEIKRYIIANDTWDIIYSLYTDANGQVDVYLVPDTLYKIFITKTDYETEIADYIPNPTNQVVTFRITPTAYEPGGNLYIDHLRLWANWSNSGTGMYLRYIDKADATFNVTVVAKSYFNSTVHYVKTYHGTSRINDTNFTTANQSYPYIFVFRINHSYWNHTINISGIVYPHACYDKTTLEDYLDTIFGDTPFVNPETGNSVTWLDAVIGVIGFIILVSVGSVNAEAGVFGMGIWYLFVFLFVTGTSVLLGAGGLFMVIIIVIGRLVNR